MPESIDCQNRQMMASAVDCNHSKVDVTRIPMNDRNVEECNRNFALLFGESVFQEGGSMKFNDLQTKMYSWNLEKMGRKKSAKDTKMVQVARDAALIDS